MRDYLQQASTEMENRIASNPVPTPSSSAVSSVPTTQSVPSVPSAPSYPSPTQPVLTTSPVDTYKRITATLPKDFSLCLVCNKHLRVQIIILDPQ